MSTSRKKQPSRRHQSPLKPDDKVPLQKQERFAKLYHAHHLDEAQKLAETLTVSHPNCPFGWKALGSALLELGQPEQALAPLNRALSLDPNDAEIHNALGKAAHKLGQPNATIEHLRRALDINPEFVQARLWLTKFLIDAARYDEALAHIAIALRNTPKSTILRSRQAHALTQSGRFSEGLKVYEALHRDFPNDGANLSNLGSVYRSIGRFEEAEEAFKKAFELKPDQVEFYSNYLQSMHYNPSHGFEEIYRAHLKWDNYFRPARVQRTHASDCSPQRRLRVGMISAGFRVHPVGQMITSSIEALSRSAFDLYAYTMSDQVDPLTERMRARVDHWQSVTHLDDVALAQRIREDRIDILLDLCGHTEGNRLKTFAQEPAPLQVKWVGGQINTTGLSGMDYMLTDMVETPPGVDAYYTEKLIRLPDDYICYMPCGDAPEVGMLPAYRNGYVTFGCFNNPSKVNDVVIKHWANILRQVRGSHLFLKGNQYNTEEFVERICTQLELHGIERERLVFEGHSPHYLLLDCYNRVDIALDPWPYSGGLTTCEALLMGVPVITFPGPTFAGRHSATHLTNAGLPELVVDSWEKYESLAIELAGDLDNLCMIRRGLRQQLTSSPICDYKRFSFHLNVALRAIWQRYCEGKAPAALTFDKTGQATFDGESQPVTLVEPEVMEDDAERFRWNFTGKVIVLDNGAKLMQRSAGIDGILKLGAFGVVAFDPASRVANPERFANREDVQLLPHAALGDGQPATLYATLDPAASATLEPLPAERLRPEQAEATRVLTRLPVNTVTLDSIEGLESLDWLILDDKSDAMAVLENGTRALQDTLLLQVRLAFQPTHRHQPDFAQVSHWASRHGFRFYRFNDERYRSQLPADVPASQRQATELDSADALYLPSHERMASLSDNQRMKLAFVLDTVFGATDVTYDILHAVSSDVAERYRGYKAQREMPEVEVPRRHSVKAPAQPSTSSAAATLRGSYDWQLDEPIQVVDIGANPIDGSPPYKPLLSRGMVSLVGFEPQRQALAQLNAMKGPHERYLPYAVGDGKPARLYLCQAPGMTSTLRPNAALLDQFQGYPLWGKVNQVEVIETVRLDDVDEVGRIDWLKIDIQGGELTVFKNAEEKLKNTLVIQTEVNFISLYEGQPLFAEIDQWMRGHGFMLHTLLEERKRLYAPMVLNGQVHRGFNQLTTADAVYVPDFDRLESLKSVELVKLACMMHEVYGSFDYSLKIMRILSDREDEGFGEAFDRYFEAVKNVGVSFSENLSHKAGELLINHEHSYLKKMGWIKSLMSKESVARGAEVPWVTYPFLHFFESKVARDFSVFEYGSGNSTLWLSRRVKNIVSVEHDVHWYKKMEAKLPGNVDYIHHELVYGGRYGKEILKEKYAGRFDVVFVDGRDRVNCLRNSLSALKDDGVVVLDNAERESYVEGTDFLMKFGFKRIDFIGMGPVNIVGWSTAVFYRDINCLGL